MTSLGLTFHSRPTPALCILTSPRCVSYILYLSPFPLPVDSHPRVSSFVAARLRVSLPGWFLPRTKREEKTERYGELLSTGQPPISWTKGWSVTG
jgi:hypothetical protein